MRRTASGPGCTNEPVAAPPDGALSSDQPGPPRGPQPGRSVQPGGLPAAWHRDWAAWVSAALVVAANVLAVTGYPVPFLGPALGFWFLIVHPVYLLCTTSVWGGCGWAERLGYSLGAVLLLALLGGLGLNTVLPLLGAGRPLDPLSRSPRWPTRSPWRCISSGDGTRPGLVGGSAWRASGQSAGALLPGRVPASRSLCSAQTG